MTPQEYQLLAARTENDQSKAAARRHYADAESSSKCLATRLCFAGQGLSSEAGEFNYALLKWLSYGQPLDATNLKEELGDALWYVACACNALGLDRGEVMSANIAKLRARFPEKYADSLAAEKGRDRAKEREVLEQPIPPYTLTVPAAVVEQEERRLQANLQERLHSTTYGEAERLRDVQAHNEQVAARATEAAPVMKIGPTQYSSYDRNCSRCSKKIHKTSKSLFCPDCAAATRTALG